MKDIQLEIEIGITPISLFICYDFIRGAPEQGPSYASGGQPADPDEVHIRSIDWAHVHKGKTTPFNLLEHGVLWNIIAEDEWIYNQICEAEYANHL